MEVEKFQEIVSEEFERLPEKFRKKVKNVALLIEDEPSQKVREEEGLSPGETLLGYYCGIPNTERGSLYGVGPTLPDTITIYRKVVEETALETGRDIREIVYETIWHEIAHYFGMDEREVMARERIVNES